MAFQISLVIDPLAPVVGDPIILTATLVDPDNLDANDLPTPVPGEEIVNN
jgi:hypothetical protein